MKKILGLMAVAAMMVGMLATPALARNEVGVVGPGTATVGRSTTGCQTNGNDTVAGNGLYLPTVDDADPGYWQINAAVASYPGGLGGVLNACGGLTDALGTGVGAACGASRGQNGQGKFTAGDNVSSDLSNLTWDPSVGGTLVITGTSSTGDVYAVIQAQGGRNCVAQISDNGGAGAQSFAVAGVFANVD